MTSPPPPPLPRKTAEFRGAAERSQAEQLIKWLLIPLACIILMLLFLLATLVLRSSSRTTSGNSQHNAEIGPESPRQGNGSAASGLDAGFGGNANENSGKSLAQNGLATAPPASENSPLENKPAAGRLEPLPSMSRPIGRKRPNRC